MAGITIRRNGRPPTFSSVSPSGVILLRSYGDPERRNGFLTINYCMKLHLNFIFIRLHLTDDTYSLWYITAKILIANYGRIELSKGMLIIIIIHMSDQIDKTIYLLLI